MPVPEAAVDENDCLEPGEDEVRLARKVGHVQTVSESKRVEAAAQQHFGLRVLAPDARHHARTHLGCDYVSHAGGTSLSCGLDGPPAA
jgi:hypothetical protein